MTTGFRDGHYCLGDNPGAARLGSQLRACEGPFVPEAPGSNLAQAVFPQPLR